MTNQLKLSKLSPYFLALSLSTASLASFAQTEGNELKETIQVANQNNKKSLSIEQDTTKFVLSANDTISMSNFFNAHMDTIIIKRFLRIETELANANAKEKELIASGADKGKEAKGRWVPDLKTKGDGDAPPWKWIEKKPFTPDHPEMYDSLISIKEFLSIARDPQDTAKVNWSKLHELYPNTEELRFNNLLAYSLYLKDKGINNLPQLKKAEGPLLQISEIINQNPAIPALSPENYLELYEEVKNLVLFVNPDLTDEGYEIQLNSAIDLYRFTDKNTGEVLAEDLSKTMGMFSYMSTMLNDASVFGQYDIVRSMSPMFSKIHPEVGNYMEQAFGVMDQPLGLDFSSGKMNMSYDNLQNNYFDFFDSSENFKDGSSLEDKSSTSSIDAREDAYMLRIGMSAGFGQFDPGNNKARAAFMTSDNGLSEAGFKKARSNLGSALQEAINFELSKVGGAINPEFGASAIPSQAELSTATFGAITLFTSEVVETSLAGVGIIGRSVATGAAIGSVIGPSGATAGAIGGGLVGVGIVANNLHDATTEFQSNLNKINPDQGRRWKFDNIGNNTGSNSGNGSVAKQKNDTGSNSGSGSVAKQKEEDNKRQEQREQEQRDKDKYKRPLYEGDRRHSGCEVPPDWRIDKDDYLDRKSLDTRYLIKEMQRVTRNLNAQITQDFLNPRRSMRRLGSSKYTLSYEQFSQRPVTTRLKMLGKFARRFQNRPLSRIWVPDPVKVTNPPRTPVDRKNETSPSTNDQNKPFRDFE